MKAVILAAGYATRLYPLTQNFPKPLLEVGGRTILDYLVDQLNGLGVIDGIVLVTNHRFAPVFEEWKGRQRGAVPVTILDDGTSSNEDRLGAVGDLRLALERTHLDADLLVTAADNILRFPLVDFVASFQAKPVSHVCVHRVEDPERCRRTGIAVLDEANAVVEFAEKPKEPKSQWGVPPLYLFPKATLPRISEYLKSGGSPDAPGSYVEWLCRREPVQAFKIRGSILDIGTPQALEAARKVMIGSRT